VKTYIGKNTLNVLTLKLAPGYTFLDKLEVLWTLNNPKIHNKPLLMLNLLILQVYFDRLDGPI